MEEQMKAKDEQLAKELQKGKQGRAGGKILSLLGLAVAAVGVILGGNLVMIVIGGELYTAAAAEDHGTILPGVTRRSVIELAKDWGIPVHEGRISIDTITEASRNGRLEEVFATGTAAVVIPIKELNYEGVPYYVGDQGIGPLTQKFYDTLTGIQWGQLPDTKGWMVDI